MPRVDFFGLSETIRDILVAEPGLEDAAILVEEDGMAQLVPETPWVEVWLKRATAPNEIQRLRAGTSTDYVLEFRLRCFAFSLDSRAKAAELRDDLVGKVEVALMGDRTLRDKLRGKSLILRGIEFDTPDVEEGWLSKAEIVCTGEAQVTTD